MRFSFWGTADDTPDKASGSSAAVNAASSSAPAGASASTSTPATAVTPEPPAMLSRFERTLQDEEKNQAMQFPTFDEVPGCMQLFDEFFMCYALVPQLRNMYRHGELRDCTYKFNDFKYCMSLKGDDVEERRKLWIRRRAEWWAARRVGSSSEDVWDIRDKPLENFPPLYPDHDEATKNL